jgi:urate oxidase
MAAVLEHDAYGKSQVRLTKVTRDADRHDLKELTVDIQLEGDFVAAYTHGDNSRLVATDTMKNTVYALAKNHPLTDIESFAQALGRHFLDNNAHVSSASIYIEEHAWRRIEVDGRDHPHAFLGGGNEKRTCTVQASHEDCSIESGLDDLLLLKTTDSAFRGFLRDRYTTLPETDERIFATILKAHWRYSVDKADWNGCHRIIRQALLETFAQHKSLAVQQTLFAMGEKALAVCPEIDEITLAMPNKHWLLVNLQVFGMENANEIFVPTEEPYGLITGTLRRK